MVHFQEDSDIAKRLINILLVIIILAGTLASSSDSVPQSYVKKLKFYGNNQVSDARLERASDMRKFLPYSEEILKNSLVQLRDHYLINGFPVPGFRVEVNNPASDGAVCVQIFIKEISLPFAENLEYKISGHPNYLWKIRLKSVFGWFFWKSKRKGINLDALLKLTQRENRVLRESGYRNAEITIHQEPGTIECCPRILIEIMVDKPVKIKFKNVGFLMRHDILHNWKRKHVTMTEKEILRLGEQTGDRLRKNGWLDVVVQSTIEETDRSIVAHIQAEKGLRRYINVVNLTGRSPVISDNLDKICGLHSPRLMGLWKTRPDPETLNSAEKALKTHLNNLGYTRPQCKVEIIDTGNKKTTVLVNTEAGAQRTIGKIMFDRNGGSDNGIHPVETAGIKSGDPFVRRRLKEAMTAMTRLYWKNGYADVSMHAKTRRNGSIIDVIFSIDEGPKYEQGPLLLNGNVKTSSKLIYRLKKIVPGNPFNLETLGELQEAMYQTGVFESISIQTEKHPDESPPYTTVTMDIIERSTGTFKAGIDFNTDRGVEGILEIGERNLFGQALHGKISGLLGQKRWLVTTSIGRPLFFGYPLENRIRATTSDDRTNSGYSLRTYELEVSTIWHWKNKISLNMSYAYEREKIRDLDPDIENEIDIENTRSGSLIPILTIDHRDDPFRSTRGWYLQTRLKTSLSKFGSEAEFVRWDHDLRLFKSLNRHGNVVLGGALRFGRSWILNNSVMPAGERYFLGGASSNRGFDHNECGPRTDDNDPLGGLSYVLANLELRFHLAGSLHGAIFVDAGNVFADAPESPYLRTSAGFGFRYETPIGPFRADIGFNLEPEENEADYAIQMALGHAF
ncbi:BamA/TamA family outer membrane protein [bacterium]|nr:BamA/TamA family outer membrane protein [bacterium]